MLYMSNDRKKVFKTEQECIEYERRIEEERTKQEKLEMERRNRLESINKKYEELQILLSEYGKDYGIRQIPYIAPFYELLDMMHE